MKQWKIATRRNVERIAEKLTEQGFFVLQLFDGNQYYLVVSFIR